MNVNQLRNKYVDKCIVVGEEQLFLIDEAINFTKDCANNHFMILGLGFYRHTHAGYEEIIGGGADFSSTIHSQDRSHISTNDTLALLQIVSSQGVNRVSFILLEDE